MFLSFSPLEALACQTPVLTTRSSSLPEVLGPHAYYTNPDDMPTFIKDLEKMATRTKSLTLDEKARQKKYTSDFTWKKLAQQTLSIYKSYI